MKAQEQERIRIAGELHDGVMQEMLAVTMMLGTAKRRIADTSEAKATIDKAQQKLIQAGTDIRQLSHDLHPPLLQEAGLPKAVQAYASSSVARPAFRSRARPMSASATCLAVRRLRCFASFRKRSGTRRSMPPPSASSFV